MRQNWRYSIISPPNSGGKVDITLKPIATVLLIGLRVISTAKQDFCNLMCPHDFGSKADICGSN